MSRRTLRCLRCGGTMELLRREFLQLGKTGWVLGDLDNLLAGALDVDILCCSDCGKLEFFRGEWSELEDPEGSGIARELGVPVKYAGVGEGIDDLRPFDALEFAQALI